MQTAIAYLVAAKRCEIDEFEQLNRTCELVRAVSELVQNLQCERGISNVYRTSEGMLFAARWEHCNALTDLAGEKVLTWLDRIDPKKGIAGGSRLFTRIAVALHALDSLPSIRASVQKMTCTPEHSTDRYSHLIGTLLALVFEAADIALDPEVSRLLVALFNLMQGKEFVGQERAAGARVFARGHIAGDDLRLISDVIELQEQCFVRFESFCGESIFSQWTALQSIMPLAEIERMRRLLLTTNFKADTALAEVWFDRCSKRIDDIYLVEKHLTQRLQQTCETRVLRARADLNDQQIMLTSLAEHDALPVGSVLVPGSGPIELGSPVARDIFDLLHKQTLHLQSVSEELATVRESLGERKRIERAKGVLMSCQSITEDQAYRLLRDKAMNQNRRLIDVAESVLSMADFLPKK